LRRTNSAPDTRDVKVECETRIDDGQAFLRRLALKVRDGDAGAVLVVLADTRTNRAALAATDLIAGDHFSVSPREAFGALRAGIHPGGSAFVFV
jgi:hypothetical protein